jgi:hypothetical protein
LWSCRSILGHRRGGGVASSRHRRADGRRRGGTPHRGPVVLCDTWTGVAKAGDVDTHACEARPAPTDAEDEETPPRSCVAASPLIIGCREPPDHRLELAGARSRGDRADLAEVAGSIGHGPEDWELTRRSVSEASHAFCLVASWPSWTRGSSSCRVSWPCLRC